MKNMMLTLTFIVMSFTCSAEWRDHKVVSANVNTDNDDEVSKHIKSIDKEFLYSVTQPKNGLSLCAWDGDFSNSVDLKYYKGKVDLRLNIYSVIYDKPASLSIDFLDEDGFLVKNVFISNITSTYQGKLFADFQMDSEKFCLIKYYELHARERKEIK